MESNDTSKFEHVFEGYSVWIEPCPDDAKEIMEEMELLSSECGGAEKGTYPFALHCTLLYNFDSSRLVQVNESENNDGLDGIQEKHEEMGLQLLQSCIQKYKDVNLDCDGNDGDGNDGDGNDCDGNDGDDDDNNEQDDPSITIHENSHILSDKSIFLNPTDFYFFPYPKHADNGRGFGCVIPMLLLENNENLQQLQRIVSNTFPPDERHSGSNKDGTQSKKGNNKFIPHMALVYAPEIYHDKLKQRMEQMKESKQHFLTKPLKAKYLSLWSTKGMLKDWKLVCKVDLDRYSRLKKEKNSMNLNK